jgi:CubicO group peptidase (beta-lactamase class C family)
MLAVASEQLEETTPVEPPLANTTIVETVPSEIIPSEAVPSKASPQSHAELAAALEDKAKELEITGFQAVIYNQQGIEWSHQGGFIDQESTKPVTARHMFRAGSTTKTFVALAIMQLTKQGKFNLQDKLLDLAPEIDFENPYADIEPVRLIHLLEHTAGFDDMHFKNIYDHHNQTLPLLDVVNRDSATLISRWAPGTRSSYSNPGYGILGYLIEKYSGQSYESYLETNILRPLGMHNSRLSLTTDIEKWLSDGFEDGTSVVHKDIYLRSAGALYTNAEELSRIGQYLLTRGTITPIDDITSQDIELMESQQSTLAGHLNLANRYGMAITASSKNNIIWHGHNGGVAGFLTAYAYSPNLDKGYAFMMNSSTSRMGQMMLLISEFLGRDFQQNKEQHKMDIAPKVLGYYRMASDRNQLIRGLSYAAGAFKVTAKGPELTIAPYFGSNEHYIHLGDNLFASTGSHHAVGTYINHPEHGEALDIDGVYLEKISMLSAWLPIIIGGFALLMIPIMIIYLPVWLINIFRGKFTQRKRLFVRALPVLSIVFLISAFIALQGNSIPTLGTINIYSILYSILSIIFALLAIAAAWSLKQYVNLEASRFVKVLSIANVSAVLILSIYLTYWGYIGMWFWAY